MYSGGLLISFGAGLPTMVLGLATAGRLLMAAGSVMVVLGVGNLGLAARAPRQRTRTFE